MADVGREAAIYLADEQTSAKHQLRLDTGLSGSFNIAANLSGPNDVRFYRVLTGYQMTETGPQS